MYAYCQLHFYLFKAVVLKMVDIDPQGSFGPSKGSINSYMVEWGPCMAPKY